MASAPAGIPPLIRDDVLLGRPSELEDGLNRFVFHPLAARLARLLRPTRISPNAVSVLSMLFVWAAAGAYIGLAWPQGALIGFSLHLLWHVVDGADGDLARLTGRSSPTGELVDGICDYTGHVVLYIALAAMLDAQIGGWAWALATAAGASHIAQTNHAETQRRTYLWWAYGVPWLKHARAAGDRVFTYDNWFSLTFGWIAHFYLQLAGAMTPHAATIDRAIEAAGNDPRRTKLIRRLARWTSRRSLLFQKAVGPNPRTIILGASMLAGSPLYYFLAEIVLLNLLLFVSVRHHNWVARRLAVRLRLHPREDG